MSRPWPSSVRERMTADRRLVQIIDVATRLISERGFWGITVQDVADACGITVAGVLHHVGTKDGLLVAVLKHRDQADVDSLAAQLGIPAAELSDLQSDVVLRTGITAQEFCRALVQRNASQPEIVRLYTVLNAESLDSRHPAHSYFADRERRSLRAFADLVRGNAPDPEEFGMRILAAMDGLQLRWLRAPDQIDLVMAWDRMAAALFGNGVKHGQSSVNGDLGDGPTPEHP